MTLRHLFSQTWHARGIVVAACAFALQGCVTIYQPFSALERPVVLDLKKDNLKGLRLQLDCVPSEFMDNDGASALCEKLTTAMTAQGALVEQIKVGKNIDTPESELETSEAASKKAAGPGTKPDLTVQLRSWILLDKTNWWMALPAVFTLSFVPIQREYVFASQVTIVSGSGFLLSTDVYQGRFVRYLGLGYFGLNAIFNAFVRDDADEITNTRTYERFSRDFYAHVSQAAYNARVRMGLLKVANSTTPEVP